MERSIVEAHAKEMSSTNDRAKTNKEREEGGGKGGSGSTTQRWDRLSTGQRTVRNTPAIMNASKTIAVMAKPDILRNVSVMPQTESSGLACQREQILPFPGGTPV